MLLPTLPVAVAAELAAPPVAVPPVALPPPIATEVAVPANTWTELSGTVVLPPVDATIGCKLIDAEVHVEQEVGTCGTIECPDLFLDDAVIAIVP